MIRRPPRSTRTDTRFPYTTLFRSFASSKILEVHGERMIKGTFDPGFRISLHQKDLNLALQGAKELNRSEEHTSELQSLMRISYAVFCLKKKKKQKIKKTYNHNQTNRPK